MLVGIAGAYEGIPAISGPTTNTIFAVDLTSCAFEVPPAAVSIANNHLFTGSSGENLIVGAPDIHSGNVGCEVSLLS